ncbi:insulin-induced protein-domain-containing protein [Chytriomyces cf. hyalinus JEL632]|nr:insulin-induced protein-domain-containing protein [Chytriomyces cf. hyalinus JEL632]
MAQSSATATTTVSSEAVQIKPDIQPPSTSKTSPQPTSATPATRVAILFGVGFLLSILIDSLQQESGVSQPGNHHPHSKTHSQMLQLLNQHHNQHQHRSTSNTQQQQLQHALPPLQRLLDGLKFLHIFHTASWLPFSFGFAGVLMGFLYPRLDLHMCSRPPRWNREISTILRLVGIVMGVNLAVSKLHWVSSMQASFAIYLLSLGLWVLFDGTSHGFLLSCGFAGVGTGFGIVLVRLGVYTFASPDFFGVVSWFPGILFLSSVCFGSIGRGLASSDPQYRRRLGSPVRGKVEGKL